MFMSATSTTPITREAGRIDALNTVHQMFGEAMTMSTTMTLTTTLSTFAVGPTEHRGLPPRNDGDHSPPVGMARPIANDLVWPGHPEIWESNLFNTLGEGWDVQEDSQDLEEGWRLLHPYEQRGMLNPRADTPGNIKRMAENKELVESIQVMEHLTDLPPMGSRRDYSSYPPRNGDPYYHHSGL